ncbi:CDK5 and ABL1 enzyme substrate 1 [Entomortierella beljakovae]|nr:CDK5 and ABL1 enzyme substrate 1 [Entomortierella beljakovae]
MELNSSPNQPSPSQRNVRRRTAANRQAAFSFLSSIQLDPSINLTTTSQSPQTDIPSQDSLLQADTNLDVLNTPLPFSPSTDSDGGNTHLLPTTPTSPNSSTTAEPRRSHSFAKKDETAYNFLSTIRLRGNSINGQDAHNRRERAHPLEPINTQLLDNEQSTGIGIHPDPSGPPHRDLTLHRPTQRSTSSPSLSSEWTRSGNSPLDLPVGSTSTRQRKVTSPGLSHLRDSQHSGSVSKGSTGGMLSTLLAREDNTETQSPSSEMGLTLLPRYPFPRTPNRWLGPLTDNVYIKPLITSGTSHIVKKIFKRPPISIPKRSITQSQASGSQSTSTPRRTLNRSNTQSSQIKQPHDRQHHIFYKGEDLANSCVSLGENLSHHAFMLTTQRGSPLILSSIIKYNDDNAPNKRRRRRFDREYLQQITKEALVRKKANSFANLLTQSNALSPEQEESSSYDPYYLDDPELKTGKNRTVISLACYMGSVIQYTRPSDLKRELNEHFRSRHPTIDPSITLSKIRKVKTDLLAISEELDLEISTTALSYAYFEKLVMKGSWKGKDSNNVSSDSTSSPVTKENRKLIACVCLLLAYKVNEPKRPAGEFNALMKQMTKYMDVITKDIKDHEFQVFSLLEFNLYLPRQEFLPHFEQILYRQDYINVQEYLGEDEFYSVPS